MEIKINKDSIMLAPETEFERDTLKSMFPNGHTYKAFIKTGLSINDVVGLKITNKEL